MDPREWMDGQYQKMLDKMICDFIRDIEKSGHVVPFDSIACVPTSQRLITNQLKDEFWLHEIGIKP